VRAGGCYSLSMASARRWIAVTTLVLYAGLEFYYALLARGWDSFNLTVFGVAIAVAAVGLGLRIFWARWLALGIGVTGLLSVATLSPFDFGWFNFDWGLIWFVMLPALLLVTLLGRSMKEHCSVAANPLWQNSDLRVRALSLAVIGTVPTVAGLLLYAGSTRAYWIGTDDRIVAVSAALLFTAGAIAALMGRTVSLFVLFASGCAALGLATESMFRLVRPLGFCGRMHFDRYMVEVTLSTLVPGALVAVAAALAFTPAMARFLMRER
jgi:hypothetical protein